MTERHVPVSLGSPRFQTMEVPGCMITVAWFPPGTVIEPHVHDRPTLATMLDGGFEVRFTSPAIRRAHLACPAGALHTEPAGERHSNHVGAGGAHVTVLQPDSTSDRLPTACRAMLERINHLQGGPVAALGRGIARELAAPDDLTALAVEGMALEALVEAARQSGTAGPARPAWFTRAVELMHDRFRENVRLGEIAAAAEIHEAHLTATFRRIHGMSPAAYMRRLRVEWAAQRLATTDQPISAVAAEAGFADQAHLTRWFRRVTGRTPAAYRRARGDRAPARTS